MVVMVAVAPLSSGYLVGIILILLLQVAVAAAAEIDKVAEVLRGLGHQAAAAAQAVLAGRKALGVLLAGREDAALGCVNKRLVGWVKEALHGPAPTTHIPERMVLVGGAGAFGGAVLAIIPLAVLVARSLYYLTATLEQMAVVGLGGRLKHMAFMGT